MMKKILIAAAAAAALTGVAGAASAQHYYGPGYGYDRDGRYDRHERRLDSRQINARQHALRVRVDQGVRSGRITHREAEALRHEIRQINAMERRYRANGLNYHEAQILEARLDRLERRIYAELRDGQRYGYGYGDRRW